MALLMGYLRRVRVNRMREGMTCHRAAQTLGFSRGKGSLCMGCTLYQLEVNQQWTIKGRYNNNKYILIRHNVMTPDRQSTALPIGVF